MSEILKVADLEAAVNQNPPHPIVAVLRANRPQIALLREKVDAILDPGEQAKQLHANSRFLADAIAGIKEFDLSPVSLVSVWNSGLDEYPYRYALANMAFTAFAVQGIDNSQWGQLSRYYLEHGKISPELVEDKTGLTHVKRRLGIIGDNMDRLRAVGNQGLSPKLTTVLGDIRETSGNTLPILYHLVNNALR